MVARDITPGDFRLLTDTARGETMDWVRRKWSWAAQGRLFWLNCLLALLCILVVVLAIVQWPPPRCLDVAARLLALLLQIIGITTVWWNLRSAARHFGKDGLFRRTWKWLKAGFIRGDVTVAAGVGEIAAFTSKARATVRPTVKPGEALAERVANLEKYVEQIDADLGSAYREIDRQRAELNAMLKAESEERKRLESALNRDLAEVAAGNYAMLLSGVVWLCIGLLLTTGADIIDVLSRHLPG
jgi:hypothetical protein